jgi:hypothetical protein
MKSKSKKVSEEIELNEGDLFQAWRDDVMLKADKKQLQVSMTRIVNGWLERKHNITAKDIKFSDDFSKAEVSIEYTPNSKNEGLFKLGVSEGGRGPKKWLGFYEAAEEIFKKARSKKKDFMSFDEFYDELLKTKGADGKARFIKNVEPIEVQKVKQYLYPFSNSQTRKS